VTEASAPDATAMFLRMWSQLAVMRDLWQAGFSGRSALKGRTEARLNALVTHAREHSVFYRHLYRRLLSQPELKNLPVVSKSNLMAQFDEWVTDPRDPSRQSKGVYGCCSQPGR
jgi:hypothetical protein